MFEQVCESAILVFGTMWQYTKTALVNAYNFDSIFWCFYSQLELRNEQEMGGKALYKLYMLISEQK